MTSGNNIQEYISKFPTRSYKKRWSLANPGDNLRTIYYLKKGYVRVYALSGQGKELTLIIHKPGEIFPLLTALSPSVFPYWIETTTSADIVSIPIDVFNSFIEENPDTMKHMSKELLGRLYRMFQRMEYLAFGSAEEKVASMLLILADRFGEKNGQQIDFNLPLTQKEIANLVGITREKTSSTISTYIKKGYLIYKGKHIIIKDKAGLLKESMITPEHHQAHE